MKQHQLYQLLDFIGAVKIVDTADYCHARLGIHSTQFHRFKHGKLGATWMPVTWDNQTGRQKRQKFQAASILAPRRSFMHRFNVKLVNSWVWLRAAVIWPTWNTPYFSHCIQLDSKKARYELLGDTTEDPVVIQLFYAIHALRPDNLAINPTPEECALWDILFDRLQDLNPDWLRLGENNLLALEAQKERT